MTVAEKHELRLKILNGIEHCHEGRGGCPGCPYYSHGGECIAPLMRDVRRYLLDRVETEKDEG